MGGLCASQLWLAVVVATTAQLLKYLVRREELAGLSAVVVLDNVAAWAVVGVVFMTCPVTAAVTRAVCASWMDAVLFLATMLRASGRAWSVGATHGRDGRSPDLLYLVLMVCTCHGLCNHVAHDACIITASSAYFDCCIIFSKHFHHDI